MRRTVMKTGLDTVKAALRAFFDNAAEDLEMTMDNLKQGQFTHTRTQPKGVTQIINYTTVALLPVLSSLFEHIGQNLFGEDLICRFSALKLLLVLSFISSLILKAHSVISIKPKGYCEVVTKGMVYLANYSFDILRVSCESISMIMN